MIFTKCRRVTGSASNSLAPAGNSRSTNSRNSGVSARSSRLRQYRFPVSGSGHTGGTVFMLSVARVAILRRIDLHLLRLFPKPILRKMLMRVPIQIGDLIIRPQIRRGLPMALQTKRHAQRLLVPHLIRLMNVAMAMHATDPAVHVHRVIEINEVRQLV